jgi:FKBP-type peptidyl-prolyl cis-trans isomerase
MPKFPKGIRVKDLRRGSGEVAAKGRIALIQYDCFLPRGDKWDSSKKRVCPVQFEIGQRNVFPAIDYGVVGMAVGGVRSIRVSPQLTYYERKQNPNLPENAALRYEVELLRLSDQWDNSIYRSSVSWLVKIKRFLHL